MEIHDKPQCMRTLRSVEDTLEVISGKWKILIMIALINKPSRFKELTRDIGISPRMLSKELQDMEINQLIIRKVYETKPVTVEYSITEYGRSLDKVFSAMKEWGEMHRKRIMTLPQPELV